MYFFVEIRTLVSYLKSTLLLKMKLKKNTYFYENWMFTNKVRHGHSIILRSKGKSLRGGEKSVSAN